MAEEGQGAKLPPGFKTLEELHAYMEAAPARMRDAAERHLRSREMRRFLAENAHPAVIARHFLFDE